MSETTSALQFGLRAMKIENNTKIREEVDLRLLNYRLQAELDKTNNLYEVTLSSLEEVAKEAAEVRAHIKEASFQCSDLFGMSLVRGR